MKDDREVPSIRYACGGMVKKSYQQNTNSRCALFLREKKPQTERKQQILPVKSLQ